MLCPVYIFKLRFESTHRRIGASCMMLSFTTASGKPTMTRHTSAIDFLAQAENKLGSRVSITRQTWESNREDALLAGPVLGNLPFSAIRQFVPNE